MIIQLNRLKNERKISMVTAYDYLSAKICDEAEIDIILVGDSLGNICLGYSDTIPVKLEDMMYHATAVTKAVKNGIVVVDMPFGTVEVSVEKAKENACRLFQSCNIQALKIEAKLNNIDAIKGIIEMGIPVMAHIGFTPQSVNQIGGYYVQGKTNNEAKQLIQLALKLEEIGCCGIVLELIPADIADKITKRIKIPTIGIGAGPSCDGQVLVFHDLIGYENRAYPKFVKNYVNTHNIILTALKDFKTDIEMGDFPMEPLNE